MVLLPNVTSWKNGSNKLFLHQNFNHFIFTTYMQPKAESYQFEQLLKISGNYVFHPYIWSLPIDWYMYVHSVEFAMWKNNGSLNISYASSTLFAYREWARHCQVRNLIFFIINKRKTFREIFFVCRVFTYESPEIVLNRHKLGSQEIFLFSKWFICTE